MTSSYIEFDNESSGIVESNLVTEWDPIEDDNFLLLRRNTHPVQANGPQINHQPPTPIEPLEQEEENSVVTEGTVGEENKEVEQEENRVTDNLSEQSEKGSEEETIDSVKPEESKEEDQGQEVTGDQEPDVAEGAQESENQEQEELGDPEEDQQTFQGGEDNPTEETGNNTDEGQETEEHEAEGDQQGYSQDDDEEEDITGSDKDEDSKAARVGSSGSQKSIALSVVSGDKPEFDEIEHRSESEPNEFEEETDMANDDEYTGTASRKSSAKSQASQAEKNDVESRKSSAKSRGSQIEANENEHASRKSSAKSRTSQAEAIGIEDGSRKSSAKSQRSQAAGVADENEVASRRSSAKSNRTFNEEDRFSHDGNEAVSPEEPVAEETAVEESAIAPEHQDEPGNAGGNEQIIPPVDEEPSAHDEENPPVEEGNEEVLSPSNEDQEFEAPPLDEGSNIHEEPAPEEEPTEEPVPEQDPFEEPAPMETAEEEPAPPDDQQGEDLTHEEHASGLQSAENPAEDEEPLGEEGHKENAHPEVEEDNQDESRRMSRAFSEGRGKTADNEGLAADDNAPATAPGRMQKGAPGSALVYSKVRKHVPAYLSNVRSKIHSTFTQNVHYKEDDTADATWTSSTSPKKATPTSPNKSMGRSWKSRESINGHAGQGKAKARSQSVPKKAAEPNGIEGKKVTRNPKYKNVQSKVLSRLYQKPEPKPQQTEQKRVDWESGLRSQEPVKKKKVKAKSKIGSLDNVKHRAGGGEKRIQNQKLDWKAQSKVGSVRSKNAEDTRTKEDAAVDEEAIEAVEVPRNEPEVASNENEDANNNVE